VLPISSITSAEIMEKLMADTDVEGKRTIRALEAAGLAWLMFNGVLFVPMILSSHRWPAKPRIIMAQAERLDTAPNA
jgi:hypothetical protein